VTYLRDEKGIRVSRTDYNYGYGRALADGVVRPVLFLAYAGKMRWRTKMGDEFEARLGQPDTKDITAQAWRTALAPDGDWIPSVLAAADRRLTEVRHSVPDAGGLVIATDQTTARAYAKVLEQLTGESPTVVLSDERASSDRIESFAAGDSRWMVAVRMVSEGVDVPRLSVGVYATSAATPLYFAQAIGRFVRARRRGETASIFLPSVPSLMALAALLELERDHALDRETDAGELLDDALMEEAEREERASDRLEDELTWQALESDANFDRVLFEGNEFGFAAAVGSEEELDFLGIPGILEPDQVRELLQARQARQSRRARMRRAAMPPEELRPEDKPMYRNLKEQRAVLNGLVGMRAKLSGEPHAHIHAELRRVCGGPPVAQATVSQLQDRIDYLRKRMRAGG
jgi:superfamily II DNA or RNA helicase